LTTPILRPEATVEIADQTIEVSDGEVTLDTLMVPYARATLTVPVVDPEDVEAIDPREDLRAEIVAGDAAAGTSRAFNLGVRGRVVDHVARTIELELASDEALLMDWAPLELDDGARQYESSLRDVVDYVLDTVIPGTSLEAGSDDADVTAYWSVTNLVTNPSVRGVVGNWIAGGSNGTLTRQTGLTGGPVDGVTTYTRTSWTGNSGDGQGGAYSQSGTVAPKITCQPFKTYSVSCWVRANVTKAVRLSVQVFAADGSVLSSGVDVATATLTANTWTRLRGTITMPANAATAGLFAYCQQGTQWSNGNTFDTLGWLMHEGTYDVPSFDAATTDANYTYAASGEAHVSASTRTPHVERLPELFEWKPGVTAWEFLEPLTSHAGLRLFCDEHRKWRLVNPETYNVPGVLSVAGWNSTEGTDRITREDPNLYCTGVVVVYEWEDGDGVKREAVDTAGEPGRVLKWTFNRPYPGPGAAAAILSRRAGIGRVQDVTALASWLTAPGMEASITLPGADQQLGQVQAVRWRLNDGLMDVTTKQLIDVSSGAWIDTDADLDWDDVDADTDWDDWAES